MLEVKHLSKSFGDGNQKLDILRNINLCVEQGDFVCISGQSGSGKSTLLHLLGLLDSPDSGVILINGEPVSSGSAAAPQLRNKLIGFVFQFHYLMDDLTTLENVALPMIVAGSGKRESLERARGLLKELDMENRAGHYPNQLSGGEQQRAALGRAMINQPALILADEPTGNLDPGHCREVLDLFARFNQRFGCTFILATHDLLVATTSKIHYKLENGALNRQH